MLKTKVDYFIENEQVRRTEHHVMSPFRYPGGKYYGLKFILPFINCIPHDEYREPFVGGGCVFFAKLKSRYNWLNDLDGDLMKAYKVIANPSLQEELIKKLSKETASKERHLEIKNFTPTSLLDEAFRIYYLNRTSYSGIINKPAWGYEDGKSSPPKNWGKFIISAGEKLRYVRLTDYDFSRVITEEPKGKSVLMYLDPPYFHADQKRAYVKSFISEDHHRLEKLLRKTAYSFCLSYDDCPEIRDLYHWANIHKRSWFYNSDNCRGKSRKAGNELIITNYKVKVANLFQEEIAIAV